MMREAMAHGLGNQGWSVPIWGPHGEFALFCAQPHDRRRGMGGASPGENAKDILVVSHLMHEQAMRIINKEMAAPTTELSPREREALTQLSLGQSRARGGGRAADLGEHAPGLYRLAPATSSAR